MRRRIYRSLIVAAVMCVLLILPQAVPAGAAGFPDASFQKSGANPVVTIGASGAWNEAASGSACVILDGNTYKMWFTGARGDGTFSIGYAESSDGVSWTPYANNPVMGKGTSGSWKALGVGSPWVIKDDNSYKMWFTGYAEVGSVWLPQIGYATSTDGITNWTPDPTNPNPILPAGAVGTFSQNGVLAPSVIKESESSYKMWFTGRSNTEKGLGTLKIGYATSSNGTSWQPNTSPVFQPLGTGWESRGVGVASVILDGGTYTMWYTGYTGTGSSVRTAIGSATSTDGGINWGRFASNPVLTAGATGSFEQYGVGSPCVVQMGTGQLKMWYTGLNASFTPRLGVAKTAADISGQVTLQGGARPPSGRVVPLTVKVFEIPPAGGLTNDQIWAQRNSPLKSYSVTTVNTGSNAVTFSIVDIATTAGTYDVTVESPHTLMNIKRNVIWAPGLSINLGTLKEGNANDDRQIQIKDFSILAASYLKSSGQTGFDARADFDRNGQVQILDFSLLAANYLGYAPIAVP